MPVTSINQLNPSYYNPTGQSLAGDYLNIGLFSAFANTNQTFSLSFELASLDERTAVISKDQDDAGDTFAQIQNLKGSSHDDVLWGTFGTNVLEGGLGNDVLIGRAGIDTLYGGAGSDLFDFNAATESQTGLGTDNFMDFHSGDLVDLTDIDANTAHAGNQAFTFVGKNEFSGTAGELRSLAGEGYTTLVGEINGDQIEGLRGYLGLDGGNAYLFQEADILL